MYQPPDSENSIAKGKSVRQQLKAKGLGRDIGLYIDEGSHNCHDLLIRE